VEVEVAANRHTIFLIDDDDDDYRRPLVQAFVKRGRPGAHRAHPQQHA